MPDFAFNIFDPQVKADPYPYYARMRETGRVLRNPLLLGQVMVHRYVDVQSVLTDNVAFSSARLGAAQDRMGAFASATMLNSDPPDHTRLRGVVSRAFTPRAVARMEPRIREIAAELVAQGEEPFDVPSGLSSPLPVIVIAEMLGVASSDRDDFSRWSHAIIAGINMLAAPEDLARARDAAACLREYFRTEILKRRERGSDDLVARLVEANAGGVLTDEELMSSCILLLLGGNETTTNLITNAVLALGRHPDERDRLASDPELFATAVDEWLRFDAPVQGGARVAVRDVEVGGETIEDGSMVVVLMGAANRDPDQFAQPDVFDLGRVPNNHVAFGHGPHFCLGANLARLEARVAIEELLRVRPRFELCEDELEYGPVFFFRSPQRLRII